MRAVFYSVNPIGWATCKWLKHLWPGCLVTGLNGLSMREVDAPELPGDDWVRVRTLLGGICGSDTALLAQKYPADSILQAYSSLPAALGHENVAVVEEAGSAVDPAWKGARVCVEPTLCCVVRGIDPPCRRCADGQFGACENFGDDGQGAAKLPPGTSIGYNSKTGGSLGECFVAHRSQLVAVPDGFTDEQAVLTDPLACGLHAVLRANLSEARRVLVYGTGVLGLTVTASLRAVGYEGHIDALDVHEYLRPTAMRLGADEFVALVGAEAERFAAVAERTGGKVRRARFGNYMLSGGYDVVFDCVGAVASMNDSLRWTASRGQTVLVGTGHGRGVDLTPIWFTELTVIGAYGRQVESFQGRRIGSYQLVHELMASGKLETTGLLTHTFVPERYKEAFRVAMNKVRHNAIKVVLDFRRR